MNTSNIRNFRHTGQLTRSDIASTAPNAQHDPQLPWSRISRMVGQFGHSKRESNSAGKSSLTAPNSLAGGWKRFESGCTPIKVRKNDSGTDGWKFEPACVKLSNVPLKKKYDSKVKINPNYTRHVVACLLISSMNVWDSGLSVSSS